MKQMTTGKVILLSCLILLTLITIPILCSYVNSNAKPKLLNPIVQSQEASIVGMGVEPPDKVTFYTNGVMTPAEKKLMIECFLAAIVIPERDLWVNLKDDQRGRITPFYLGRTELGRVMLEQDYMLKRATSTVYYPYTEPGRTFWAKRKWDNVTVGIAKGVRLWIYPEKVTIVDSGKEMYIKQADLGIGLQDKNPSAETFQEASEKLIFPVVKDYVLKDVNFAPTRQVFRAVVCGMWFKQKYLNTIYHWYINSNRTGSFEIADTKMKFKVWDKYLSATREGRNNYNIGSMTIAEGGMDFKDPAKWIVVERIDKTASSPARNAVRNEPVSRTLGNVEQAKKLADLFSGELYNALNTTQVQALDILDKILREEDLALREELRPRFLRVARQLFLRPDAKSEDIAKEFGVSVSELREIYRVLKASPTMQTVIVEESKYVRLVEYTTKYLLKYTDTLEKSFNNQIVYPIIVEWHPGETCDSNCVFCYNKGLQYADRGKRDLLEIEKSKQLIDEWADNGVKEFWVSGGKEPLTNPTTADVIKYATDRGLMVKLYTNGINLVPAIQARLLGAKWVRISLNAATPGTYNTVQGIRPDFFDRVTNNIREFVALRNKEGSSLNIGMSFLVNPWNCAEILQAADNARDLGVDFLAFNTDVAGMVRRYTPAEVDTIVKDIETMKARLASGYYGKMNIDVRALTREELLGEKQMLPDLDKAKYCEMKVIKANMNPYGVFHLCDYAGQPINERPAVRIGDIHLTSFKDMLHSLVGVKFETTNCEGCLIRESGFNIILEKLRADRLFGIPLDEQPYQITLENGVEFLSHRKDVAEPALPQLKNKVTFIVILIPSWVPSSVDTEGNITGGKVGGVDFYSHIDVEGEPIPVSIEESRKWQLGESVGYYIQ